MNNFDLKKFLVENKLTYNSRLEENVDKKYSDFLVALRDSGVTNMYGAVSHLQAEFGLDRKEAIDILVNWMESLSESLEENVSVEAFKLQKALEDMGYDVEVKAVDDFGKDVFEIYFNNPADADESIFYDAKKLGYDNVRVFANPQESLDEASVSDFEIGDFVHFKSKNKTGMVVSVEGDKVTINTPKGKITSDVEDVKVLYQDNVNENRDLNDPIAMRLRAAQTKLDKTRAANAGDDGNDKFFAKNTKRLSQLKALKDKRAQIMRDMEQEAEMGGGPVADRYGDMLDKIDRAIAQLQGTEKEFKLTENVTTTVWSNFDLQFMIDNNVRYLQGIGGNLQVDWHLIEKGFHGAEEKALKQVSDWKESMEQDLGIEPHEEVKIVGGKITTDKIEAASDEAADAQASGMRKGGFSNN